MITIEWTCLRFPDGFSGKSRSVGSAYVRVCLSG